MDEVEIIKTALNTKKLAPFGPGGGGCVNEGHGYLTDNGPVYLKRNRLPGTKVLFDGECEGLSRLYATNTVRVPRPLKVIDFQEKGAVLAIEYLDIKRSLSKFEADLGRTLGMLHKFNGELLIEQARQEGFVGQQKDGYVVEPIKRFGFYINTSATPAFTTDNTWSEDWPQFYTRQKLEPLVKIVNEKFPTKDLNEVWNVLVPKIPAFFNDCQPIIPSLLHGDMWSGNVAELDTEPVLFDPMSFYGHNEFEFGIAEMFGGFSQAFYNAYHKVQPRAKGFSKRNQLYQLFHHLNHWCLFGDSYKTSTLSLMRRLCKQ